MGFNSDNPLLDPLQFYQVWQMYKPGEKVTVIDFRDYIVVFSRNVTFYNRTSILKVILIPQHAGPSTPNFLTIMRSTSQ